LSEEEILKQIKSDVESLKRDMYGEPNRFRGVIGRVEELESKVNMLEQQSVKPNELSSLKDKVNKMEQQTGDVQQTPTVREKIITIENKVNVYDIYWKGIAAALGFIAAILSTVVATLILQNTGGGGG